jgi:hypothetical protein
LVISDEGHLSRVSGLWFRCFSMRETYLGFRVSGFGFRDSGLRFRVRVFSTRDTSLGFRFRNSGLGIFDEGHLSRVSGFGLGIFDERHLSRIWGFGVKDLGSGYFIFCLVIDDGNYSEIFDEGHLSMKACVSLLCSLFSVRLSPHLLLPKRVGTRCSTRLL